MTVGIAITVGLIGYALVSIIVGLIMGRNEPDSRGVFIGLGFCVTLIAISVIALVTILVGVVASTWSVPL